MRLTISARWGSMAMLAFALSACGIPQPTATLDAFERGSFEAGAPVERTIHYARAGDVGGRRVVFVHGTPGDAAAFADYLAAPPQGAEFITYDRPGFGATGGPVVTSLADQAKAIEPLLDGINGERAILVGHSLGGPIIAQAAVDFPDKIGGIIIVSGALDPDLEKITWYNRLGDSWAVRWMLPDMLRTANEEVLALKAELEALRPRLGGIRCPIIVIHGTEDSLVPVENVAFMERMMPEAMMVETVVVEGKDHFLPWDSKPVIDAAIARLLVAGG